MGKGWMAQGPFREKRGWEAGMQMKKAKAGSAAMEAEVSQLWEKLKACRVHKRCEPDCCFFYIISRMTIHLLESGKK